jgi:hypothetical protein
MIFWTNKKRRLEKVKLYSYPHDFHWLRGYAEQNLRVYLRITKRGNAAQFSRGTKL